MKVYNRLNIKLGKEIDFKAVAYQQKIYPNALISNKEFCEISGVNSVGSFQYDNDRKYFTYREQHSIHKLQRFELLNFIVSLELKAKKALNIDSIKIYFTDNKYSIKYEIKNQEYIFTKSYDLIFTLLIDFYFYCRTNSKKQFEIKKEELEKVLGA